MALEDLSDEELAAIASGAPGATESLDLGKLSDDDLASIAYGDQWSPGQSALNFGSGVVSSFTSMLGMAADLNPFMPQYVGDPKTGEVRRANPLFGDFPTSAAVKQSIDPLLAPEDPKYRYARSMGEFAAPVPGVSKVKGAANLVRELLQGLLGGSAAQLAEDSTGDTVIAPMVAGATGSSLPALLEGVLGFGKGLLRGSTPAELKGSAALAQKDLTGLTEQQLEAAIAANPQDTLGALRTTSELTDNAGMAQLETVLGSKGDAANQYTRRGIERNAAREAIIEGMSPTAAVNKEGLGTALIERAEAVRARMDANATAFWDEMPRDVAVDVGPEQEALRNLMARKQAGLRPDRDVQTLVDQFVDLERNAQRGGRPLRTSGELQDIRSDALALRRAGNLSNADNGILASLERSIDEAMGRRLDSVDPLSARDLPAAGMVDDTTPDADQFWRAGRQATADAAATFERGTAGGTFTHPMARPSEVLANAMRGDSQSIREIRAALGDDPRLMNDIGRGVLDMIGRDAKGNLTAAKMKSFLNANEGALRDLFGQDHHGSLVRIMDDLRSQGKVGDLAYSASKGNSVTAQRNTVAGYIRDKMIGVQIPGAGKFANLANTALEWFAKDNIRSMEEMLFRAAMEPGFALELAKTPTTTRVFNALEKLTEMATQGAKGAAAGAVREVSRLDGSSEPSVSRYPSAPSPKTTAAPALPAEARSSEAETTGNSQSVPSLQPASTPTSNQYGFVQTILKKEASEVPAEVMDAIKKDPIDMAVMLMESGGDPGARNPDSSASGLFQLVKRTAGNLGVKNVFDAKQNYEGYRKLREETKDTTGDRPELVYAAHFLGEPLLRKVLAGKSLTATERARVEDLEGNLLPRFRQIYQQVVSV